VPDVSPSRGIELSENGYGGADPLRLYPTAFYWVFERPSINSLGRLKLPLPRAEAVSLCVYDTAGRLVRTLLAGAPGQAGRNETVRDGRDDQDRQAASGVYLYQLTTPSNRAHGRLTLVK
jgi:hypothetical protein